MRCLILISALLLSPCAFSQFGGKLFYEQNRFNDFDVYESFSSDFVESKNGRMVGLGFDLYTGTRSFIGADYAVDARTFASVEYYADDFDISLYEYASHSFNFRSGYVITNDAELPHLYSSISVGIRTFKESGTVEIHSSTRRYSFNGSNVGVPFGLRLGFKSATDGQFFDVWVGFNVLATGSGILNPVIPTPFSEINPTAMLWGAAYGISGY